MADPARARTEAGEHKPGSSSQMTPRWSKPDSNRWSFSGLGAARAVRNDRGFMPHLSERPLFPRRDLGFESGFLQRRVTCEPELRFSRHRPALLWIRRADLATEKEKCDGK